MTDYRLKPVVMEGVRILFRNFAGKADEYNRAGDRNFAVLLDPATADAMARDGWNVKALKQRDEDEQPGAYLPVAVNFDGPRPPQVQLITSRGKTHLDKDTIEMLDYADILNVDLIVNPYEWVVNGKTGVKAYLKSIYVTIEEDELERKYNSTEVDPPFDGPYRDER